MAAIQLETDLGTALLSVAFGLSMSYFAIGNIVLFIIMRKKGSKIGFLEANLPLLEYYYESPRVRSKALDRFALSLVLSIPVAVAAGALAYPRFVAGAG